MIRESFRVLCHLLEFGEYQCVRAVHPAVSLLCHTSVRREKFYDLLLSWLECQEELMEDVQTSRFDFRSTLEKPLVDDENVQACRWLLDGGRTSGSPM